MADNDLLSALESSAMLPTLTDPERLGVTASPKATTSPLLVAANSSSDETSESDEGDADSSSEDEGDEEILPEPSRDIKVDLVKVLKETSTMECSFYSSDSYPNAPDPSLTIETLGPLVLPLSVPEAKRLISVCSQAPFGKNERTIVDKSVRDTWELEHSKVHFASPEWADWISGTAVPAALKQLGVTPSLVEAHLYKLLIYETGSHFLAHQDTEKTPGMFASMIVALPSPYTGGSLHLAHTGQTKIIDVSSSSSTTTSVFAWFSDVFHAVEPVTSGYRLALSYNLVIPPCHTSGQPPLNRTADAVARLRHVLLSWRQDTSGNAPTKLVYNLDHQYSIANLGSSSLKGKDAHMISLLRPVAERLHFRIFLANIELYQCGQAEMIGPPPSRRKKRYGSWRGYDNADQEEKGDHGDIAEVEASVLELKNVVDLDGNKVNLAGIKIQEDKEMIPFLLSDKTADQEEYEGYQGNYGGTLEYWYRRTAIILYPKKKELKALNRDPLRASIDRLREKMRRGWLSRDSRSKHISVVLQGCATRAADPIVKHALSVLCECAELSHDPVLWIRAVRACGAVQHIDRFGIPNLLSGISVFGLDDLKTLFEDIMRHAVDNTLRYTLAKHLVEESQRSEQVELREWAAKQQRYVRDHLKPLTREDLPLLFEIGQIDGMPFFSDCIVTQIENFELAPKTSLLFKLVRRLQHETTGWPDRDDSALERMTQRLTTLALARLVSSPPIHSEKDFSRLMDAIKLCEKVDLLVLLNPVIENVAKSFGAQDPAHLPTACTAFLLPFLSQLEVARTKSERLRKGSIIFAPLYGLLGLIFQYGLVAKDITRLMPDLMLVLPRFGGIEDIRSMLTPHVGTLARHDLGTLKTLCSEFYRVRNIFRITTDEKRAAFRDVISILVDAIAANTSMDSKTEAPRHLPGYQNASDAQTTRHTALIELIRYCLSFGDESLALCGLVMGHVRVPGPPDLAGWFSDWFCPFILLLRILVDEKGLAITAQPFGAFFAQGIRSFVSLVVGQKPHRQPLDPALLAFGCGCSSCQDFQQFLEGTEPEFSLCALQAPRKHLEKELKAAKAAASGLTWVMQRTASRQGWELRITKPDYMVAPDRWCERASTAIEAIRSLGDTETQKSVLSDDYDSILASLELTQPLAISSSSTSSDVNNASHTLSISKPSSGANSALTPSTKRPAASFESAAPAPKKAKVDNNSPYTTIAE